MSRRRKPKFDGEKPRIHIEPKTIRQREYLDALKGFNQVIVLGPAGTGKTYVASSFAASLWQSGQIDRIVLTRPNVASGRSIGFFPGSLEEKMAPWMGPVIDTLNKHLTPAVVEIAIKSRGIDIVPFETMRGRSFENAFVILDEAQNTTPHEMKMFLTRIGENCRVVINGDVQQSDLRESSGLTKAIHMAKRYMLPVPVVEFGVSDIVRSDLCRLWIEAWIKEEKND